MKETITFRHLETDPDMYSIIIRVGNLSNVATFNKEINLQEFERVFEKCKRELQMHLQG